MADLHPPVGKITTRDKMKRVFGGSTQGGICPAKKSSTVLIYSDPESGERRGYKDGWLAERDDRGLIFEYTGHGEGDQVFGGRNGVGNQAILRHREDGRKLHLFRAAGKVPGSGTKLQRYIGEFELDIERPYVMRQERNNDGVLRWVIVFMMRPVGKFFLDEQDNIPLARETEVRRIPASATVSVVVSPETSRATRTLRSEVPGTVMERREARLSDEFRDFLESRHHEVRRFQVKPKGSTSTLLTDLYDVTDHVLYEVKANSSRNSVRMAVGQLLDYRRHVDPVEPKLAVLLPEEPEGDLKEYLESVDISLVYRENGNFCGYPVK
ncbi:hypothetical protein ACFYSC_06325 [Streptosporangium sp. NPDC004379]|uniref:hypothetical protein n=1 Tax=Streptosporangium sp. NPDC004379 TaxID=3366189 RepID=UPI0036AA20C9